MNRNAPIYTQRIPLDKLVKSSLNVRKTLTTDAVTEMKASILAHGLMQNLVVTDSGDGTYHVVAGARRLAALHELQSESKLPPGHAVPCQLVDEDHAFEISLAENTIRLAMHPADQFEAFAELIAKGQSAAQVAIRFGVDENVVLKRMKLGRVAAELLAAYRQEKIKLETLMAFAVTDDHAKQLAVYRSLPEWQKDNPRHIRDCLTEAMVKAESSLACFVGLDAYEAAGGTVRSDLFGDDAYLENPEVLHALAADKLKAVEQSLAAEGWGWVEVNPERDWDSITRCSRIRPAPTDVPQDLIDAKERIEAELEAIAEDADLGGDDDNVFDRQEAAEAKIAEIKERIADCVAFEPEQKKLAGCYVSIRSNGELTIDRGLVKPEDQKRLAASSGDGDFPETATKKKMPDALRRDLEAYRLQIAQAEIARHPEIAFDLLAFHVARGVFDHVSPYDGPDVIFRRSHPRPSVEAETTAAGRLEAIGDDFPVGLFEEGTEASQFEAFRKLSGSVKLDMLAYCLALTLKPSLAPAEGDEPTAYDVALSLTAGDVAAYWRPTGANYLSRITRDRLLAIGREVLGDQWAQSRLKDKKAELVDQLDRAFAAPEQNGRTPEQAAKLKCWLPDGMAFGIQTIPQPAEADDARQAA